MNDSDQSRYFVLPGPMLNLPLQLKRRYRKDDIFFASSLAVFGTRFSPTAFSLPIFPH